MNKIDIEETLAEIMLVAKTHGYIGIRFEMDQTDEERSMTIDGLDLSTRAVHMLNAKGINTVGQLIEMTDGTKSFSGIKGIGVKTKNEIMTELLRYHIKKNIDKGRKPLHNVKLL